MQAGSTGPEPQQDPTKPTPEQQLQDETQRELEQLVEIEEQKLIRRLQFMMNMVMQVIAQDHSLTIDDAAQMIADSKKAALAMFPGKELAYDLIWRPRFQRLMRERFRIM
ncbi:MAG TPA: hypothetical protein VNW54_01345 [Granulicella sp.]|nr:hypothetical protein [Granulicella sp.]